jgi:hypothetical protein
VKACNARARAAINEKRHQLLRQVLPARMHALLSRPLQQIEIDSIELREWRRLRARANTIVVPALASLVLTPLSAIVDIG